MTELEPKCGGRNNQDEEGKPSASSSPSLNKENDKAFPEVPDDVWGPDDELSKGLGGIPRAYLNDHDEEQ